MKPYPRYNQSSARWYSSLPETWSEVKAKRLFSNERERASSEDEQLAASQKYGVIPQALMMAQNNAKVMLALKGTDNFKQVKENDFVISLRSFEGGIEHSKYNGCISPAYTVLRLRHESSYPNYFRYALKCSPFIQALNSTSEGIRDGKTITYDEFGELLVVLPSQTEQKAIATFLDCETQRIDNLIEEKQTFIKLLKEKRQALISHVVTKGLNPNVEMQDSGIEWIGQVPKHWSVVQLKRLIDSIEQGWSPECLATPAKNERWGVLKSGAVNGGVYSQDENKELPETLSPRPEIEVKVGDLIMSRASGSRELIGSAAYVYATRERLMLSDKLFRLHCKEDVDAEFVAIALGSFPLRRQIELAIGGAEGLANNLSQANIKKLLIPKPPKTEQEAITSHIKSVSSKIEDLIIETNNSIALLKERKTSLISAAVTGKIDVRETV